MKLPPKMPLPSPSLCSMRTRMVTEGLKLGSPSLFWLPTYAWHSGQEQRGCQRGCHLSLSAFPGITLGPFWNWGTSVLRGCFAIFLLASYEGNGNIKSPIEEGQGRGWLGLRARGAPGGGGEGPPGEGWLSS